MYKPIKRIAKGIAKRAVGKKTNVAILMVEQNAKQALNISDRGYVLVTGENRYSGTGKELLNDPRVRSSFLGG